MDPITISIITSSISLIGTFMTGLFVLLDKCTEKQNLFQSVVVLPYIWNLNFRKKNLVHFSETKVFAVILRTFPGFFAFFSSRIFFKFFFTSPYTSPYTSLQIFFYFFLKFLPLISRHFLIGKK